MPRAPLLGGAPAAAATAAALLLVAGCCRTAAAQDFEAWDRALKAHVTPGSRDGLPTHIVDYQGMSADPNFHSFIASLESVRLTGLSQEEWKSVLMNAYNAFAIKVILDNPCQYGPQGACLGPVASIGDIGGAKGAVWKMPVARIGGQTFALQQIEDLLRNPPAPFQSDPRLHACITCASVSCPSLRAEAYLPGQLDRQMGEQMGLLLNNPQKGLSLDASTRTLRLSKVFQWYQEDFVRAAGSVVAFVAPFVASPPERAYIQSQAHLLGLAYFDWDRNVNGDPPCTCPPAAAAAWLPQRLI